MATIINRSSTCSFLTEPSNILRDIILAMTITHDRPYQVHISPSSIVMVAVFCLFFFCCKLLRLNERGVNGRLGYDQRY
jgi:hypothetical protein